MKREYDFSGGKRGPVVSSQGKTCVTLYLVDAIIQRFKEEAERTGRGYQALINEALAAFLGCGQDVLTPDIVRRIVREELGVRH
ncbi:MAG: CopG family transcriptional regulator [Thermodesulfobacteriota bacterium]